MNHHENIWSYQRSQKLTTANTLLHHVEVWCKLNKRKLDTFTAYMITLLLTADISSLINCLNVNLTYFCALHSHFVKVWRLNGLLKLTLESPLSLHLLWLHALHFGETDTDHICFLTHSLKWWNSCPFIFLMFFF